jgi:hypothetical protein
MRNISIWTVSASLFFSLAVSDSAYDALKGPVLAGVGNPQAVERGLANMAGRMGIAPAGTASMPPEAKAAPVSNQAAKTEELGPVADWLMQKGDKGAVDAFVTKVFGLGTSDMDARTKTFNSDSPKLFHFAGVTSDGHDVVLSRQKDDRSQGVVWLTSPKGELRLTAMINQGPKAEIVPNERFAKGFEAQKKYFLDLAAGNGALASAGKASDSSGK